MPHLVRFTLEEGGEVLVELPEEADRAGPVAHGGIDDAQQTFEDAISRVRPIAEAVLRQIKTLASAPDEVGVELGITLKAEAGIIIAKTAAEGNIKLSVKWKPGG